MSKKSKITVYIALATVGSNGKLKTDEDPDTIKSFLKEKSDVQIGKIIRRHFEKTLKELEEAKELEASNVVPLNKWRE
tara:strand:- start:12477 stop:12710 length:234 start_codon:yes stop_codon:yes gene_type:complete